MAPGYSHTYMGFDDVLGRLVAKNHRRKAQLLSLERLLSDCRGEPFKISIVTQRAETLGMLCKYFVK
jgi:hypothetical protein